MNIKLPCTFLLLLSLLTAFTAPAHAANAAAPVSEIEVLPDEQASFPCTKARTTDERIICSDHQLARLDHRLGEIYTATRATLKPADRKVLLQSQRAWLAGHDAACGIAGQVELPSDATECFAKRYRARTAELLGILSHGNVIRELAGSEPWTEDEDTSEESQQHIDMMVSCIGKDQADMLVPKGQCCGPGGEWAVEDTTTTTPYVINGKRYLVFIMNYYNHVSVTRGMCETQTNEQGEEDTVCPEPADTPGACTTVYEEQEPGSGVYSPTDYRWDDALTLAELLSGGSKQQPADNQFAADLHAKLLPASTLTLAPKKGKARDYRWDDRKHAYVEGK